MKLKINLIQKIQNIGISHKKESLLMGMRVELMLKTGLGQLSKNGVEGQVARMILILLKILQLMGKLRVVVSKFVIHLSTLLLEIALFTIQDQLLIMQELNYTTLLMRRYSITLVHII